MQSQSEFKDSAADQLSQLEGVVKKYLDKNALTRYGTIRAADREKATQLVVLLASLIQAGRIPRPLTDEEFKGILAQVNPKPRDIRITRK